MAQQQVIILGASGQGKVIADAFSCAGVEVVGFVDHKLKVGTLVSEFPVLGPDSALPELITQFPRADLFVAIGDNFTRHKVMKHTEAIMVGAKWATCVHPTAVVAKGVSIEPGAAVLAGAVVQVGAHIAKGSIVNTGAQLDHDSTLNAWASLAPGVVTGGSVHIGQFSAVSIGATLVHGVSVGEHTIVGAGAVVVADVEAHVVAYGIPARKVRSRTPGEAYL